MNDFTPLTADQLRRRLCVCVDRSHDRHVLWCPVPDLNAVIEQAVKDTLAAVQEHLACACGGIEGHLRTRGLTND